MTKMEALRAVAILRRGVLLVFMCNFNDRERLFRLCNNYKMIEIVIRSFQAARKKKDRLPLDDEPLLRTH